ncbi:MAG: HAD-IC family P-type ATPase, partial [Paramuribaculum sp.]|nr:HAD-IC family P-type ATPase [Paramuribaculum sp.]
MAEISGYKGLSTQEVEQSRRENGANILTPPAREPLWRQFLRKFSDPLIMILLIAGVLSIGISCYEYWGLGDGLSVFFEPVGIFMAILLATGLAFIFEYKADKEFALLNQVNDDNPVQVLRSGGPRQIPKKDVVVGDIVFINTGDEVPADGQLLEATSLSVDESTLTGEPICHKTVIESEFDPEATFPSDLLLRGTKVMEGHGVMHVTAVGDHTENGKVYEASRIDDSVKTPLNEQLERLGLLITRMSYCVAVAIIVGRIMIFFFNAQFDWMHFIAYLLQTVMIAVTLIVVAVPEGLPMAVTLSLAYSMRRMLRTNNLVRKMHACETMGATTVICTDKTGTLTQNRMQVAHADFFGNPPARVIEEGIAVNSTARIDNSGARPEVLGNPTEGALLLWLMERGVDYAAIRTAARVITEIPFSTERKYMATVVSSADGRRILYAKGAPEIIFGLCAEHPGVTAEEFSATLLDYQNQAMRTLAFAWRELAPGEPLPIADGVLNDPHLTLLGIVAISDPVRNDVPAAVGEVTGAGIKIKMVTGDTPATA